MKIINHETIAELDKPYRTALMNSISGYKPLNLLGTISNEGKTNLCIVSSVFHLGSNPPLLGMVIRPLRPHNDSLNNIKTVKQYTLNNVCANHYRNAHQTSASYASGISEFDECGFDEFYHESFKPPFVAESTLKIGLDVVEIRPVELNDTTIVIGQIKLIIANESIILADGTVDHVTAGTVAGSGLDSYYQPEFIDKLTYAKPGNVPASINP
ncbi:flavin reductase family protein [Mucilaginibacter terrae]|uniref:Flavin reductase (DIM6/NTAB) family NADH-FMN oxidoreductase RutF n=1 Tax=Mucilaginibacter terrae TaxID=1955052 RepID=A0ABU3GPM4_9SPHI|nr:flavin reductase [Mucilaginibacter terrae]MDT3401436.1 flavin reductase (DIM6/NTAB) family NADH-FMN oxidoreductase RutF [Mucilaginibacter terrae]